MNSFSWEKGPFEACDVCGELALGMLSAGGSTLRNRCNKCGVDYDTDLPELSKKAVYLDQFMLSDIYKFEKFSKVRPGHDAFTKEVHERLKRCILLQQIFIPHSDIHRDETTVFHKPGYCAEDLRRLYKFFGGDVSLTDCDSVELKQILKFAEAFFDGKEPKIFFSLDEITDGRRDDWRPSMHVGVTGGYQQYADGIRKDRNTVYTAMNELKTLWRETKPSFDKVLENEFAAFGAVRKNP